MFSFILSLFNLLSLIAIACVTSYALFEYTFELSHAQREAWNFGGAHLIIFIGAALFLCSCSAYRQLGRIIVDNIREALDDVRYAREDRKQSVRAKYGKATCTCDDSTCKAASWAHWTCPSPDMGVVAWERVKLSHVRSLSARRVRRAPRVHAIARVSVIAVSGVPVV